MKPTSSKDKNGTPDKAKKPSKPQDSDATPAERGIERPAAAPDEPQPVAPDDPIDEASWESFPASDAPAF